MGYYNSYGVVGEYKGFDVYVLDYKDLTKEKGKTSTYIFAVRRPKERLLDLVYNGKLIGVMTDDGQINKLTRYKPFVFYEKKSEPEAKVELESYNQYTQVVDSFFEGLNEQWKKMQI